jgi:hypothetical protein
MYLKPIPMENKPSTVVLSLGYGVIIALAIIVFDLILFLLNLSQNSALKWITYLILLAGIVLAQFNYRNKYLGGYIDYGKAFKLGMLTSLFLAIIMGIYTYIFLQYIDPGAMEEGMALAEQQMMDRGMSDAEIEQGMAIARKFSGVGMATFSAVLLNFIVGMVISLITAIFVKKEDTGFGRPAM